MFISEGPENLGKTDQIKVGAEAKTRSDDPDVRFLADLTGGNIKFASEDLKAQAAGPIIENGDSKERSMMAKYLAKVVVPTIEQYAIGTTLDTTQLIGMIEPMVKRQEVAPGFSRDLAMAVKESEFIPGTEIKFMCVENSFDWTSNPPAPAARTKELTVGITKVGKVGISIKPAGQA